LIRQSLDIACGRWTARIAPWLGGAILSLRRDGEDVLRPTPDAPSDVLATACFPLVPYANRIAFGRFRFMDREIVLPPNFGDHPHSLHGVGWQSAWDVQAHDHSSARLIHDHAAGPRWPWRYRASQDIALDAEGLSLTLQLENLDDAPMPAGLGFHPYFPAAEGTHLRFDAGATWQSDATQLPTHVDTGGLLDAWRIGAPAKQPVLIDHCHVGWRGEAIVATAGRTTRLTADDAPFRHVHSPPGLAFVGVEPVTQMPDAVNRPEMPSFTGLRVLAPGDGMKLATRIESVSDCGGASAPTHGGI